jgi:hypothetical protein
MDRVLASEASGHRYRFAEASYKSCHPRCCALMPEAYIQQNDRLKPIVVGATPTLATNLGEVVQLQIASSTCTANLSPGRQVGRRWSAKLIIRGFLRRRRYANDSHPGVQSLQRSLMAKPQAHNLVIASISFGDAYANKSRRCDQCTDGVTATSRSPKPLFEVQILVCALLCKLKTCWHGIHGAEAKWSSGTSFKRVINGFKSRLHCQTCSSLSSKNKHRSARLSAWATVCKTAASCVAGATPARPTKHGE